jgi:hypothetical protein
VSRQLKMSGLHPICLIPLHQPSQQILGFRPSKINMPSPPGTAEKLYVAKTARHQQLHHTKSAIHPILIPQLTQQCRKNKQRASISFETQEMQSLPQCQGSSTSHPARVDQEHRSGSAASDEYCLCRGNGLQLMKALVLLLGLPELMEITLE